MTDHYAVFPYVLNRDAFPEDVLSHLYDLVLENRLESEIFHECPSTIQNLPKFLDDFPSVISSIFVDLATGGLAGFAWLTDIAFLESELLRGVGSFCFFRDYWHPQATDEFGKVVLSQWYNLRWKDFFRGIVPPKDKLDGEGFDLIVGLTPKPNRLARRYCVRLGFRYISEIPDFTSYHGKTVPGLLCVQNRTEFNERLRNG